MSDLESNSNNESSETESSNESMFSFKSIGSYLKKTAMRTLFPLSAIPELFSNLPKIPPMPPLSLNSSDAAKSGKGDNEVLCDNCRNKIEKNNGPVRCSHCGSKIEDDKSKSNNAIHIEPILGGLLGYHSVSGEAVHNAADATSGVGAIASAGIGASSTNAAAVSDVTSDTPASKEEIVSDDADAKKIAGATDAVPEPIASADGETVSATSGTNATDIAKQISSTGKEQVDPNREVVSLLSKIASTVQEIKQLMGGLSSKEDAASGKVSAISGSSVKDATPKKNEDEEGLEDFKKKKKEEEKRKEEIKEAVEEETKKDKKKREKKSDKKEGEEENSKKEEKPKSSPRSKRKGKEEAAAAPAAVVTSAERSVNAAQALSRRNVTAATIQADISGHKEPVQVSSSTESKTKSVSGEAAKPAKPKEDEIEKVEYMEDTHPDFPTFRNEIKNYVDGEDYDKKIKAGVAETVAKRQAIRASNMEKYRKAKDEFYAKAETVSTDSSDLNVGSRDAIATTEKRVKARGNIARSEAEVKASSDADEAKGVSYLKGKITGSSTTYLDRLAFDSDRYKLKDGSYDESHIKFEDLDAEALKNNGATALEKMSGVTSDTAGLYKHGENVGNSEDDEVSGFEKKAYAKMKISLYSTARSAKSMGEDKYDKFLKAHRMMQQITDMPDAKLRQNAEGESYYSTDKLQRWMEVKNNYSKAQSLVDADEKPGSRVSEAKAAEHKKAAEAAKAKYTKFGGDDAIKRGGYLFSDYAVSNSMTRTLSNLSDEDRESLELSTFGQQHNKEVDKEMSKWYAVNSMPKQVSAAEEEGLVSLDRDNSSFTTKFHEKQAFDLLDTEHTKQFEKDKEDSYNEMIQEKIKFGKQEEARTQLKYELDNEKDPVAKEIIQKKLSMITVPESLKQHYKRGLVKKKASFGFYLSNGEHTDEYKRASYMGSTNFGANGQKIIDEALERRKVLQEKGEIARKKQEQAAAAEAADREEEAPAEESPASESSSTVASSTEGNAVADVPAADAASSATGSSDYRVTAPANPASSPQSSGSAQASGVIPATRSSSASGRGSSNKPMTIAGTLSIVLNEDGRTGRGELKGIASLESQV